MRKPLLDRLGRRLADAKSETAAAEAAVAAISADRLAELKQMPARRAARLATDPSLTATDRRELDRFLQRSMHTRLQPQKGVHAAPPAILKWPLRHYRMFAFVVAAVIVSATAWRNTPEQFAVGYLTREAVLEWQISGQVAYRQPLPRGSKVGVIGTRDGVWVLRAWADARGYVTSVLPYEFVVLHRP